MTPPPQDPTAQRLAAGLLAGFFALFGWFTLWNGGITLKSRSGATRFVDGTAGLAVACAALLVASFGVTLLLRSLGASRAIRVLAFVLLFGVGLVLAFLHR